MVRTLKAEEAARIVVSCINSEDCVVVCVGNELRRDDAAALQLCRSLKSLINDFRNVVLCEGGLENCLYDIVELNPSRTMIIDAAYGGDIKPGDLVELSIDEVEQWMPLSTHAIPFELSLNVIQSYIGRPLEVHIIGIGAESLEYGEGMSERVLETIRSVVEQIKAALQQ